MLYLNACSDSNFLSAILFGKTILNFLSIIVPIILVLMVSIELCKIIFGDANKDVPKVFKSVISKMLAAVAIFFIPTIVNLLLSLLNQTSYNASACWVNANSYTISEFKTVEEAKKLQEEAERNREIEEDKKEREKIQEIREKYRKENAEKAEEERKKYGDINGGVAIGNVIYYNQYDYKAYPYSSYGTIASHGCGPTSAAVITSTFLGAQGHTPVDTTKWICNNGGCSSSGSITSVVVKYMSNEGLNVTGPHYWTSNGITDLMSKLSTGKYLALILVHNNTGRAVFTRGGHFFVLTGVKNGEFTIAQVSSRKQTEKTWPISAFNGDVDYFYLVSK